MFGSRLVEAPDRATSARDSIFLAVISQLASVPLRALARVALRQTDQSSAFGAHWLRSDACGQPYGLSFSEAGKHQLLARYTQSRFERLRSRPRVGRLHYHRNSTVNPTMTL